MDDQEFTEYRTHKARRTAEKAHRQHQDEVEDARVNVERYHFWLTLTLGSFFFGVTLFLGALAISALLNWTGLAWAVGAPAWIFIIGGVIVSGLIADSYDDHDSSPAFRLKRAERNLRDHLLEMEEL